MFKNLIQTMLSVPFNAVGIGFEVGTYLKNRDIRTKLDDVKSVTVEPKKK